MKNQTLRAEVTSTKLTNGFVTATIRAAGRSSIDQLVLRAERAFVEKVIPGGSVEAVAADKIYFAILLNALAGSTIGTYYIKVQLSNVATDKAVCFMMYVFIFSREHGVNTGFFSTGAAFRNLYPFIPQSFQSGAKRAKFSIDIVMRSTQHTVLITGEFVVQRLTKNMPPVLPYQLIQPEPGISLFIEDLRHLAGAELRMKEMNQAIPVFPDLVEDVVGVVAEWFFKYIAQKGSGFIIRN